MHSFSNSGVIISEVKIRNFRSIKEVDVRLGRASILIGENNSGKSSFIDALDAAIGQDTKKRLTTEDIFLGRDEIAPPKDRHIIIDICVRPYDIDEKKIAENFSRDWVHLWGKNIQTDKNENEFFGLRIDYHWNAIENDYQYERFALKEWKKYTDFRDIETLVSPLASSLIEPISLFLLDAKRDIQDEFRSRSSFWNRLLSDLFIDDKLIQEIEDAIQSLNSKIVDTSEVLQHIQTRLDSLDETVNLEKNSISINPLTRHLRDLYKGADVTFSTKGASSFSIANHGMGTRSLATILTFKAYCEWKERKSRRQTHTIIALEEPEVHLHPQAQRALISQIKQIFAQKIISTHSPYIASETNIEDFIFFRKIEDHTLISQLNNDSLSLEEKRKIKQQIMDTKGEMLYSRVLLLFEGMTEREAIPVYAEEYWGKRCECHGISMVSVDSDNYYPFIYLAIVANIPWYIIADGEDIPLLKLSRALNKLGLNSDINSYPNIVYYPDEKNYEKYILWHKYRPAIESGIVSVLQQNAKHKEVLLKEWRQKSDSEIIDEMLNNKTKYAKPVAESIAKIPDKNICIPKKIKEVFDLISHNHMIRRCDEAEFVS